jgi:hypothetical protein
MFKLINTIVCFLLISYVFPVNAQDNFKVFFPEFIPSNESFEVSIITSKKFAEADKLDIYFLPDISLDIIKIELWTDESKIYIPFNPGYVQKYAAQFRKVSINFSDTTLLPEDAFFQIVISLKTSKVNSNGIKFFGEYSGSGEILGYLASSDSRIISDTPDLYKLTFNYYEKYFTAETAASLSHNSYLNVPLVYNFDEQLVFEFWIKFRNYRSSFLEIINWETNLIGYYLAVNANQMLLINSRDNESLQIKPFFISTEAWYHFMLNFDKRNQEISVICNDEELAVIKIENYLDFENLVSHFQNDFPAGEFRLDQLRLVSVNGSLNAVSRNRNFQNYSDDSSRVIFLMNFSRAELEDLQSKKMISSEKIRFVKSDAPIFPRAPEINVKLLQNFYEIEWEGGNYKDADYYVLQRAKGTEDFADAGRQPADNKEEKIYSLLSEKHNTPEIVYFRIKQVNKDGSEVYSDVVKVGQGIVEDVIIGQNYPNPFNPVTLIEFELLQDTDVEVKVFDLAGKEVSLLHSGFLARGFYQFKFDASGFPSGIYLYQVITPLSSQTRKMILAK